jgi:hypothetical protein
LVSPPDGQGYQVVWFFHTPDQGAPVKFLGLSLHELSGIHQAYGHHDTASALGPDAIPEPLPHGRVHRVRLPGSAEGAGAGARLLMLETDFGYGRRLVRKAQARSIAAGQPLPIEYRLMGPWLWQYRDDEPDGDEPSGARVKPAPLAGLAAPSAQLEASVGLLYHPAFRGWMADGEKLLKPAAMVLGRLSGAGAASTSGSGLLPGEMAELTRDYFDPPMVKRIRGRLKEMGEWLERAGEHHVATLSWASAESLAELPPEKHPLVRAMVELGLQMMVDQLRSLR